MGVGGQYHAPAALTPTPPRQRDPVPTVQEAGWAPRPAGSGEIMNSNFKYITLEIQYETVREAKETVHDLNRPFHKKKNRQR